jgi:aryl-alcohol dehydrogenase-like predicted oxidoreductase
MFQHRLAIGTANWGKEYNGAKVSEDDQKEILDFCQCNGIDTIDTATAYEWDWTKVSSYFNVIVKVQSGDGVSDIWDAGAYCVMAHNSKSYRGSIDGVSLYEPRSLDQFRTTPRIAQAPYSVYDRRFEPYFQIWKKGYDPIEEIHVRSIFLRGKVLEKVKPHEAIVFCLMNPYIDKVILGADSFEQFRDNLAPLFYMNNLKKDDPNIIDPRKW